MSEVNHASVLYPSPFPLEGRLPRCVGQVQKSEAYTLESVRNRCATQLSEDRK